ncbi:uncharacterized protein LOC128179753 [Crassostrea angulata]|uniref:uncharacterized protein LOC128179753 n=1 Tax=Magallana angulata TaxID=2784310 RepID=UPI0022B15F38|nr:uncharacterized protein LOC128179753 [Crassostrea angulata]
MSDNCRVSEALYAGLCDYIGTPTEVTVRREVGDMVEKIQKPAKIHRGYRYMYMTSGSDREGFRFESSDIDTMGWFTNHKVISDLAQSIANDLSKYFIILMEDIDTPPGFVRLQLLTPPQSEIIESLVVPFSDGMYISNVEWRQMPFTLIVEEGFFKNIKQHGPCTNFFYEDVESDFALCFHCSYWSRLTLHWRKRCTLHNWPPNHVFDDILGNGCHIVPIGSKIAGNENELEWRLSFSQAEQKLVYSMNHTQFLCYGLLKIFLKEIVNGDIVNRGIEEPFLCSYFVKTTMFWLIQIGHITWSPNKLLDCFWKSFKFLLHCVYQGVMPNFFIPRNNMFVSKLSTVKGVRTRECLFTQLNGYYEMGVTHCLLQSPTVRKMIEPVICTILVRIDPLKGHIKSAADIDICFRNEIFAISVLEKDVRDNYFTLRFIISLSIQSLTQYKTLTLQKYIADELVTAAFLHLNTSTDSTNKAVYRSDRLVGNLLKLAGRVGDVSCLLYLAMYYYRTCRYREALHVTARVKSKLTQPYIMYYRVDRVRYNESVAGWSLSKRMKKAWVYNLRLYSNVYYVQEFDLEQKISTDNGELALDISPYVLTDMLSVLCNYRLGNRSQCLQSLTDLQTLLLYDDGRYVPLNLRDLSCQILGICQHVVGDLHGAEKFIF